MERPSTPTQTPFNDIINIPCTPTRRALSLFSTPRHRKTPRATGSSNLILPNTKWPRIGKKISIEEIVSVTKQIFGYEPRPWQLKLFAKCAEGYDTFAIAGTGYGKSLVFALLAIAVELAGCKGTVMIVCPLKSLELDQVARFNMAEGIKTSSGKDVHISAVAINEDNKDITLFRKLEAGFYRICYASPELLLRNNNFKKLYRKEKFRQSIIVFAVDEAHVIKQWKDSFRKDYDELQTLKVISGAEIPWMALTATCTTSAFETIYDTLCMGGNRRFWGIDMGADRPNVRLWVRPMEYSSADFGDLLAFIPEDPSSAQDFDKIIFYFKSRALARRAYRRCRRLIAVCHQHLLAPFTRTNSPEYKKTIQDTFREGKLRWIFATTALGLGLDIPDIKTVVIYGLCDLDDMFQEGGRAGRDQRIKATMIWLVEPWALDDETCVDGAGMNGVENVSKKAEADKEKRLKLNPDARAYINRSQSNQCMREFICDHFRPKPSRRGFEWYKCPANVDEVDMQEFEVMWEVEPLDLAKGPTCGCSAKCCRVNENEPIGLLTNQDHARIQRFMEILHPSTPATTTASASGSQLRCSKPERENLKEQLVDWRDRQWALVGDKYPFFSRDWILSDEDLKHIVDKAHVVLNATAVNQQFISEVSKWILTSPCLDSLCQLLEDFRVARIQREAAEALERPRKRMNKHVTDSDPFLDPFIEDQPFVVDAQAPALPGMELCWNLSTG